jgi:hypothetical protein
VKVDPFIEVEKAAGHNVAKACGLLEVSKSAYYQRRNSVSSQRRGHRRRAARADQGHPRRVQGNLWRPADPQGAPPSPHLRQAQGDQADASGRPRGTVQEALAQDHRGRSRRRGGPRPHSAPLRAVRRGGPSLCRRHHLHRYLGGLGLPGDRSSTWPADGSSARPWPITCAPSWSKTRSSWRSCSGRQAPVSSSIPTAAVSTRAGTTPSWPGPTTSCSRWDARANAGTTRWPRASSPRSSASSSTPAPGHLEQGFDALSSSTSRAGTTPAEAALDPRLPQPRPIQKCPTQRRPSGSMINTSNLSVEPDRAHDAERWWRDQLIPPPLTNRG